MFMQSFWGWALVGVAAAIGLVAMPLMPLSRRRVSDDPRQRIIDTVLEHYDTLAYIANAPENELCPEYDGSPTCYADEELEYAGRREFQPVLRDFLGDTQRGKLSAAAIRGSVRRFRDPEVEDFARKLDYFKGCIDEGFLPYGGSRREVPSVRTSERARV